MTSLWTRVLDEHRRYIVPIAMALILNLIGYVLVVHPRGLKAAGAAERASRASNALRTAQRDESLARGLVTGKAQADQELADFYQKVLPPNLASANRMTYASLPALARQSNVKFQARTSELDEERDTGLGHLQIHMVLQGDYQSLRHFIYSLETAPEFVIIDDVTLTETKPEEPITLLLNLSTYFGKRSNAD